MAMQVPNPFAVGVAVGGPRNTSQGLVAAPDVASSKYNEADRLQQAGGEFSKALDQWQKEIDLTRAQDATNKLNQAALKLKYGDGTGQNGWVNQLGRNALERESGKSLAEENLDALKTEADAISKTLGNARQKAIFQDVFDATRTQMSQQIGAHTTRQFGIWQDSVDQETLDSAFKMAKSTDPTLRKSGIEVSRAIIEKIYNRRGMKPDYSKGPGIIHSMAVEDMVDAGRSVDARRYLRENEGEMSAQQVEAARKLIDVGIEADSVASASREILASSKTLPEALKQLGSVDPRIRSKVRTNVRQAFDDEAAIRKAQNAENKRLAWLAIANGGRPETSLMAEISLNDPQEAVRIQRYFDKKAEGGVKFSDPSITRALDELADRDPEAFRNLNILADYGAVLTTSDIRGYQKQQRNIQSLEFRDFVKSVKERARIEGVRSSDIAKVGMAASLRWDDWLESHQGKIPTQAEQERMTNVLFSGEKDGWIFDSAQPQWRVFVENPRARVSEMGDLGWSANLDEKTMSEFAVNTLKVTPPTSWNDEQRKVVESLYQGNGWPADVWAKATKRAEEFRRKRKAEGKRDIGLPQAVIEAMAKAMVFDGVK